MWIAVIVFCFCGYSVDIHTLLVIGDLLLGVICLVIFVEILAIATLNIVVSFESSSPAICQYAILTVHVRVYLIAVSFKLQIKGDDHIHHHVHRPS
jgi:hypothetical protein